MKKLEITINKRLLIVEYATEAKFETEIGLLKALTPSKVIEFGHILEFICSGSDLTEEIAAGMVDQSIHTGLYAHYVKDIPVNTYCYKEALPSFISAIKATDHAWGNPMGEDPKKSSLLGSRMMNMVEYGKWQDSESRTFHPERCIIFEIVENEK